ncbi:hypothetical protein DSO57_1007662 [Entomophthora muscae]|uniref:Uncharacterized protein n=1 Tax=Entomophthora muscae TaxID=34485 RepID=A0ACC2T7L1_9FUNG|nr:hypothetical protein DSO57_1007662 [Entomophthora muscae]
MELPMTPKPMPASSPNLLTDRTGKLFGIVYITLTGVIDTIIPASGLRSWVGKSFSYLFKLVPLLWWALPAKNLAQVIPENNRLAAHVWFPDKDYQIVKGQLVTDPGSTSTIHHYPALDYYCHYLPVTKL